MKRILGLDLGTASIGWAVVDQAVEPQEESSIIKLGVRVNPLTVDEKDNFEKGKSITTTADRTLKRGMRRNLQRYKLRRDNLISIMKRNGLITDDSILAENGNATTFETYRLRAKAANEEISLEELARVLLMINKKRGYKSNRKINAQEDGELIDGMDVARKLYDEHITPGEYIYSILQSGKRNIPTFYRSDLNNEFDAVWNFQKQFYPNILTDEFKEKLQGRNKTNSEKLFGGVYKINAFEEKDKKTRLLVHSRYRAQAISQKLDIEIIAMVLASINGAIASSSGYLGSISDHSKELFFNKMTVGQYLWSNLQSNPHFSTKNVVFYRQDYLNEFEQIWETQKRFHPELTAQLKEEIRDVVIFYQRKLKSQKGLISFCELEGKQIEVKVGDKTKKVMTGPKVCPKSSPYFQEFKIWQFINNLAITDTDDKVKELSLDDKLNLFKELSLTKELTASAILKTLGLKPKLFNINYDKIQGNTTQAALFDAYKKILDWSGHDVEKFDKLSTTEKLHLVKSVFEAIGAKTDFLLFDDTQAEASPMFKLWHLIYSFEGDSSETGDRQLVEKIAQLTGLDAEYAKALAAVNFVQDYGSLSTKAIKKILPFMKQGFIYSDACEKAGYRHWKHSLTKQEIEEKQLLTQLELLPKNSLRNPVVEKILNQMIHVVNAAVEQYGPFDEIHLEMARDLKQSQAQRETATKRLNERTKETNKIVEILQGSPFYIAHPSRNDILRFRLYQELAPNGYKTLYTNTYISQEKLFSREFDIEHIIPQAKLFDDSYVNKTLETRDANIKKGDMTALEYVQSKFGEAGVEEYKNRIAFLNVRETKEKYRRLLMREADIPSGFLNRDLTDSQYIAKKARELLSEITRTVVTTTGAITARLREDWQLIDMMKELNWDKFNKLGLTEQYRNDEGHEIRRIKDWTKRNDHRHHALDALTIAFTRLQHIQLINNANASDGKKLDKNAFALMKHELTKNGDFLPPMPYDTLRAEAIRALSEVLISIKAKNKVATPHHNKVKGCSKKQVTLTPRGQLHNETVYGARNRYVTKEEKVNASFNAEKIATVARKDYREALLRRLAENNGDAKKAFTGKNALDKNPLFIDSLHSSTVPVKVKTVTFERFFTIRKPISKDLKIDKVIDPRVREILKKRLEDFGNKPELAFSNLDENPIWLNKDKGIAIKRVTISGASEVVPLHEKRNHLGAPIIDENGNYQPADYVSTSNNHHVAIFEDADGNYQERIVSLFEAMACANHGLPIIDRNYKHEEGWRFCFTMKRNEYFVFPDIENGFNPAEIDLKDERNYALVSKHLYRVQKLATRDYTFRHHLETNVQDRKELRNITWKRIQNCNGLKGVVKVRVNHLGKIVVVGEY